jgi:hypothetical protein
MRTWSLYDLATGLFTGERVSLTNPADLAHNVAPGLGALEGAFDHLAQRVALETGAVVDWIPPAPTDAHLWDERARRWITAPGATDAARYRTGLLARIRSLEAAQARPLRELAIDPHDLEARRRLQAIDEEIAAARVALRKL